jgi:hypothetical protein
MTVSEMIEELRKFPQDKEVRVVEDPFRVAREVSYLWDVTSTGGAQPQTFVAIYMTPKEE